jgi:hypothetical protein
VRKELKGRKMRGMKRESGKWNERKWKRKEIGSICYCEWKKCRWKMR